MPAGGQSGRRWLGGVGQRLAAGILDRPQLSAPPPFGVGPLKPRRLDSVRAVRYRGQHWIDGIYSTPPDSYAGTSTNGRFDVHDLVRNVGSSLDTMGALPRALSIQLGRLQATAASAAVARVAAVSAVAARAGSARGT